MTGLETWAVTLATLHPTAAMSTLALMPVLVLGWATAARSQHRAACALRSAEGEVAALRDRCAAERRWRDAAEAPAPMTITMTA